MRKPLKHITAIITLFALLSFLTSCFLLPGDRYVPTKVYDFDYTEATVINYSVDGCSWMLKLKDGKKLEPVNLKDEFKKDNLNVWIQYNPYKGNSSCMAGEMITLTAIEIKK
jgi:hypothetical protein